MWTKLLLGASLLLTVYARAAFAVDILAEEFRVGPVYQYAGGALSIAVELPYGVTQPSPSNFRLLIDSPPVIYASKVQTFLDSGKDLGWLLCIDVSGSMSDAPIREIKGALHSLLTERQHLRVGLVAFGSNIKMELPLSSKGNDLLITQAIDGLKAERGRGRTRLYQALYEALDYIEQTRKADTSSLPQRTRILVISDGKDEGSGATAESVIERARAMGVPIDAVGMGRLQEQYSESLNHIARVSGGRYIRVARDVISLEAALSKVHRELVKTQTVVASFAYEVDASKQYSSGAMLELELPGATVLRKRVNGAVPVPRVPASSTTTTVREDNNGNFLSSWWLPLALAAIAVLVGGFLLTKRFSVESQAASPPDEGAPPLKERFEEDASISTSKPMARRTLVGGSFSRAQADGPYAVLLGVSGAREGQRILLDKEEVRIGANRTNDLVLDGDEYVSAHHADIRFAKGDLTVFDQGSRNGTFLNEQRVAHRAVLINPGDKLRIGETTFVVQPVAKVGSS